MLKICTTKVATEQVVERRVAAARVKFVESRFRIHVSVLFGIAFVFKVICLKLVVQIFLGRYSSAWTLDAGTWEPGR